MENALAPRIAPAARPAPANALAGLYFDPRYSDVATNPTQQRYDSQRLRDEARAELLDPSSAFNRIAMGFIGPATIDLPRGAVQGVRAFHGSPHRFDRFDMSRIGTGEGAQAYGHGLYFAEAEDVARTYRDTLARDGFRTASGEVWSPDTLQHLNVRTAARRNGPDLAATISRAEELLAQPTMPEATRALLRNDIATLRALQNAGGVQPNLGSMYEVNLRVSPDRLLDWDAPLSQQPQAVQDATREILYWQRGAREALDAHRATYGEPAGRHFYSALEGLVPANSGGAFAGNPQAGRFAAEELRDAGIPGLRYLDGGSRAAGEGSRNYVIFDDALIEILRRYGLLGMLGGGAAAASGGEAEAAQ